MVTFLLPPCAPLSRTVCALCYHVSYGPAAAAAASHCLALCLVLLLPLTASCCCVVVVLRDAVPLTTSRCCTSCCCASHCLAPPPPPCACCNPSRGWFHRRRPAWAGAQPPAAQRPTDLRRAGPAALGHRGVCPCGRALRRRTLAPAPGLCCLARGVPRMCGQVGEGRAGMH